MPTPPVPVAPPTSAVSRWNVHRRTPRLRSCLGRSAAAVLLLGLALTGCSDSSGDAPTPTSSATSPGAAPTGSPGSQPTRSSAQTPVPAPSSGDVNSTVSARPTTERSPVGIDEKSKTADDVTVQITRVRALEVKAQGPGEVSGPGVAITVRVTNGGSSALSLALVSTALTGKDGDPASEMSGDPANPLDGSVAPGATAEGVYVFTLSTSQRSEVRFTVSVDPGTPTAVFEGPVS